MVGAHCLQRRTHRLRQATPRRAGISEARTRLSRLHRLDQKAGLASSRELLAAIARRIQVTDSAAQPRDPTHWLLPVCRTGNSTAGTCNCKDAEVRTTIPVDAEHPGSGCVGFVVEFVEPKERRRLWC